MIVLIGESGSGKTTILNELAKRGYQKATNYTTRSPRVGEEELKEYIFVDKQTFLELWETGKLLQKAEFNGNYYGISIDSLTTKGVCISIVESIQDIKNRIKELNKEEIPLQVIYLAVPEEVRIQRMQARGDSKEAIYQRIQIDKIKFEHAKEVADAIIENENLQDTIAKIIELSK